MDPNFNAADPNLTSLTSQEDHYYSIFGISGDAMKRAKQVSIASKGKPKNYSSLGLR